MATNRVTEIDSPAPKAPRRQKRAHGRSRNGCGTCRLRHKHCDEAKPICVNCSSTNRDCEYPQEKLPLREQRLLSNIDTPGTQQPWSAVRVESATLEEPTCTSCRSVTPPVPTYWQHSLGASFDPFATFVISMPLQSVELLQYFDVASQAIMKDRRKKWVSKASHDPAALRSLLLLGVIHHLWSQGQVNQFAATYYHHKLETIRLVNEALGAALTTRKAFCECIRQIATLAMVEALLFSDVAGAERHMQGLTTLMDHRVALVGAQSSHTGDLEEEISQRYFLFVAMLVQGVKARNADLKDPSRKPALDPGNQNLEALRELQYSLSVIGLVPSFLSPQDWSIYPRPIDVFHTLEMLRTVTRAAERKNHVISGVNPDDGARDVVWTQSTTTRLWRDCMEGHVDSLTLALADDQTPPRIPSSWSGMHATVIVYESFVIDIVSAGDCMEERLLCHVLAMVDPDLRETRFCLQKNPESAESELWLWKAFVGSFSLRVVHGVPSPRARALQRQFNKFVREAAAALRIRTWNEALLRLERIAWPSRTYKSKEFTWAWKAMILGGSSRMPQASTL